MPKDVPVTHNGNVIGEAVLYTDGSMSAHIHPDLMDKETKTIFCSGELKGLSVAIPPVDNSDAVESIRKLIESGEY